MTTNGKLRYSMHIQWSDEDNAYLVTLPEWPNVNFGGPHTHGDTYEEAAKNGREVLEMLIEGSREDNEALPDPAVYVSKDRHTGSFFDDFLKDEGIHEECTASALKRVKEPSLPSENIFEREIQERNRQLAEYAAQWGFSDLNTLGQAEVKRMAEEHIRDNATTDEAEMQKVYDDTKKQYLEYSRLNSVRELACANLAKINPKSAERMRSFHAEQVWKEVLERLQTELAPAVFATWFKDTTAITWQFDVFTVAPLPRLSKCN